MLTPGQIARVTDNPAFAAPKGDVDYSTFPGHPHGQGTDRISGLLGMEADAPFGRSTGIVMLHPVALENLCGAIIHAHRDKEVILHCRLSQKLASGFIQADHFSHPVKLCLRVDKRIVTCFTHLHLLPPCSIFGVLTMPIILLRRYVVHRIV